MSCKNPALHFANPFPVLPNRPQGNNVAPIQDVLRGRDYLSFFNVLAGVAEADGRELEDARIAIAVDHTARAAVADELVGAELVNAAHRLVPGVATVEVEVPI